MIPRVPRNPRILQDSGESIQNQKFQQHEFPFKDWFDGGEPQKAEAPDGGAPKKAGDIIYLVISI